MHGLGLAASIGTEPKVVLTGGVALNVGVVGSLEAQSAQKVAVPAEPQLVGALGAALYAVQKGRR